MNHSKATQKEIADYLNAVRKSMQGSPEEEIDEVILHLQEQINVALQESGEAADQADTITGILSAMSPPESFAVAKNAQPRESRKGVVALTLAVISLLFALFLIHPLFLLPVLTPAIVLAVISRKTVPGKVAIALLIVIPIWYAVITPVKMVPKQQEDRTGQSGHRSVDSHTHLVCRNHSGDGDTDMLIEKTHPPILLMVKDKA
ncbi:MAG: hypothetical protein ACPIGG_09660 [Akkermansiaceae bacterium]